MPDLFTPPLEPQSTKPPIPPVVPVPTVTPAKEQHVRVFSAFSQAPANISFQHQKDGETIMLFLRRHFITNTTWITFGVFLLLLPFLLLWLVSAINIDLSFLPARYVLLLVLFYYLIVISFLFTNFFSWFYNIFFVTNIRLIDIDYENLLYLDVSETTLDRVEDVNYKQVGFTASFFNYGDLTVETSGEHQFFEAAKIPKPSLATRIIEDLLVKNKTG